MQRRPAGEGRRACGPNWAGPAAHAMPPPAPALARAVGEHDARAAVRLEPSAPFDADDVEPEPVPVDVYDEIVVRIVAALDTRAHEVLEADGVDAGAGD